VAAGAPEPERWPDHAALLLAALGPGPRLWERGPGHPETLTVRLGTADRSAPDGSGTLPSVPVTAGLREVGALGLAGPRGRLSGLARAVVAQLAALHSPDTLEITLISTDRSRSVEERTAEWSWLGWLPHLRPTHGQDCRLLLAYDREQATARTEELVRRLEDHLAEVGRASAAAGGAFRPGAGSPDDSGAFSPSNRSGGGERREPGTERGQGGGASGRPGSSSDDLANDPTRGTRPRHPSDDDPALAGERTDSRSRTTDQTSGPAPARAHPTARDSNTTHLGLPRSGTQTSDAAARGRAGRPSWARSDDPARAGWQGPHTVVVVDGDPGSAGVREAVSRLAAEGPQAGIHVICLAETPSASPASPVTDTYEAACAASPAFRECGAVALLSGDVATALRLLRVAHGKPAGGGSATPQGGPVGHGTVAAVDAVSMAWAERFARALAPLRADGVAGDRHTRVSAPLPQAARLLDELGLARATPASLMARWADAADDTEALGGRATAVLGAGPRGPVSVDLSDEGPHLLVEGPSGSGRTELLRSVAASLAAAERPDRLGIVLIDGRDSTGGGAATRGDGLQVCTDLPHVTTHLGAHDPVRMREFAQSLSAELKRRAELLGRLDFAEWHAGQDRQDRNDRQARHDRHDRQGVSGRVVAQRSAAGRFGRCGWYGWIGGRGRRRCGCRGPRRVLHLHASAAARRGPAPAGGGPAAPPARRGRRRPGRAAVPRAGFPRAACGRFGRAGAGSGGAGRGAARGASGRGDRGRGPDGRDGAGPAGEPAGRSRSARGRAGGARAGAGASRRAGRSVNAVPGGPGDGAYSSYGDAAAHGCAAGVGSDG
jgi:hypothetical protein